MAGLVGLGGAVIGHAGKGLGHGRGLDLRGLRAIEAVGGEEAEVTDLGPDGLDVHDVSSYLSLE